MALVVLFVLSVLGAGVMFSTQTEMWNSANLRGTTQARYVAEAGVSQAVTWLNSTSFSWTNISSVLLNATYCNYSAVPVYCTAGTTNFQPVIGSSTGNATGNWGTTLASLPSESASAISDFQTQSSGFLSTINSGASANLANAPAGSSYTVSAQLLQLNQPATGLVRAKWKLISVGSVPGIAGNASSVQVEEVVESTQYVSGTGGGNQMFPAALWATGTGCGTVTLNGGGSTGSYNSTTTTPGTTPVNNYAKGDIWSSGNVSISQGYYIGGSLYSSLTGVDSALDYYYWSSALNQELIAYWGTANGYAGTNGTGMGCDATHLYALNEDNSGNVVTGGLGTSLTQYAGCFSATSTCPAGYNTANYLVPPATPNANITAAANNVTCSTSTGGDGGCGGVYNWSAPNTGTWNPTGGTGATEEQLVNNKQTYAFMLTPSTTIDYGNVNLGSSNVQMHLTPGTYNFNSLSLTSSDTIVVDLPAVCTTPTAKTSDPGCRVTINLVGKQNSTDTAMSLSGGAITNAAGRPGNLLIQYNGNGAINIDAGASMFATIYAPNATFTMQGGVGLYGGVVAKTAKITQPNGQHPMITYDTSLATDGPALPGGSTPMVSTFHVDEFSWSTF
jgi:hypothetical protein